MRDGGRAECRLLAINDRIDHPGPTGRLPPIPDIGGPRRGIGSQKGHAVMGELVETRRAGRIATLAETTAACRWSTLKTDL